MTPRADILSASLVGRTEPAPRHETALDARQQAFQRALAGLIGKAVQGEILAKLTDGSFLVNVAGTPARMLLPSNPPAGSALPLTLIALSPRPTFQISTAPQLGAITALVDGAAPALAAFSASLMPAAAMRASGLPTEMPAGSQRAGADAPGSALTLSETARVISGVLAAASRAAQPQTAIVAALPLLAAPSANPAALAMALKNAIDTSGLFYESHVAEWSAGTRPRAALDREPQMQMQRAQRALAGAAVLVDLAAAPQAAMPGASSAAATATAAADPATAQFINLQLASLEQGRVAWQGQLWPGQDLAWQISRDAPEHEHDDGTQPEPAWRSALRLRFPMLGEIGAAVVVSGEQVHIELQAGSGEIGALLRARAGTLRSALAAAGSTLTQISVAVLDGPDKPGEPGEPDHD